MNSQYLYRIISGQTVQSKCTLAHARFICVFRHHSHANSHQEIPGHCLRQRNIHCLYTKQVDLAFCPP